MYKPLVLGLHYYLQVAITGLNRTVSSEQQLQVQTEQLTPVFFFFSILDANLEEITMPPLPMIPFHYSFNIVLEILAKTTEVLATTRKINKRHTYWQGINKTCYLYIA